MKVCTSGEAGPEMAIRGMATLRAQAEACMSLSFTKGTNSFKIRGELA